MNRYLRLLHFGHLLGDFFRLYNCICFNCLWHHVHYNLLVNYDSGCLLGSNLTSHWFLLLLFYRNDGILRVSYSIGKLRANCRSQGILNTFFLDGNCLIFSNLLLDELLSFFLFFGLCCCLVICGVLSRHQSMVLDIRDRLAKHALKLAKCQTKINGRLITRDMFSLFLYLSRDPVIHDLGVA